MPQKKKSMTWRQRARRALERMKLKSNLRRVRAEIHNKKSTLALLEADQQKELKILERIERIENRREAEVSRFVLLEIRANITKIDGQITGLKDKEVDLQMGIARLG